jgi:hypothetical protein
MTYRYDTISVYEETFYWCALAAVGQMLFGPIFALGALYCCCTQYQLKKLKEDHEFKQKPIRQMLEAIRRQRIQAQADVAERETLRRRRIQAQADASEREAVRRQRIQAQANAGANAAEHEVLRRQRIQDEANAQEARRRKRYAVEREAVRRQRIQAQANAAEREAVRRQRVQAQADATEREARYEYSFNFR